MTLIRVVLALVAVQQLLELHFTPESVNGSNLIPTKRYLKTPGTALSIQSNSVVLIQTFFFFRNSVSRVVSADMHLQFGITSFKGRHFI